jgi:hypothetical protein
MSHSAHACKNSIIFHASARLRSMTAGAAGGESFFFFFFFSDGSSGSLCHTLRRALKHGYEVALQRREGQIQDGGKDQLRRRNDEPLLRRREGWAGVASRSLPGSSSTRLPGARLPRDLT